MGHVHERERQARIERDRYDALEIVLIAFLLSVWGDVKNVIVNRMRGLYGPLKATALERRFDALAKDPRIVAFGSEVQAEVEAAYRNVYVRILAAHPDALKAALDGMTRVLVSSGIPRETLRIPTPQELSDLIGKLPGGVPVPSVVDDIGRLNMLVRNTVVEQFMKGASVRGVTRALVEKLNVSKAWAATVARSSMIHVYREASIRTMRENRHIVDKWVWIATLDDRTCQVCWAMHGTVHDLDEPFGTHANCRCTPVHLKHGETLSDIGVTPGTVLFEGLDDDRKKKILGPGKYALYTQGRIGLPDVVDYKPNTKYGPTRNRTTLKQIGA